MLEKLIKSVLDQDRAPIVLCDLNNIIVYMNSAAVANYRKYGGEQLLGKNLLDCHNPHSIEMIKKVVDWFGKSADNNIVFTFKNEKDNKDVYMIALRDENGELIGYYEKHEYRNAESMPMYNI